MDYSRQSICFHSIDSLLYRRRLSLLQGFAHPQNGCMEPLWSAFGTSSCQVSDPSRLTPKDKFFCLVFISVSKLTVLYDNHVLGQTTDSGSNNNTMAFEMEVMFAASSKSVNWDSSHFHARCYCHKLALVVKAGLKALSIESGHAKPTTEGNLAVPIPTFQLNDKDADVDAESADSDEDEPLDESDLAAELPDEAFCSTVEEVLAGHTGNIFATAVQKVIHSLLSLGRTTWEDSYYGASNAQTVSQ